MYIELFQPRYFLPFAGRYTLAGKLYSLNGNRGEPELEEAYDYLVTVVDQHKNKAILLNPDSSFDITTGNTSDPYIRIDPMKKTEYVQNILSKRKLDYENDEIPSKEEILKLIPKAYERFEQQRKNLNFESNTHILLEISDNEFLDISCKGEGYSIIPKSNETKFDKYIRMSLDGRLLKNILEGPKKAHWNNAEIGAHIMWKRVPNIYERGIYHCLNFLHC